MVSLLQKEPQHGKFADEFTSALNASGLEKVEATPFVSSLLFKKNDQEIVRFPIGSFSMLISWFLLEIYEGCELGLLRNC